MKWFHRHGPWEIIGAYCDRQAHYIKGGPDGDAGLYAVTHLCLRCKECSHIKHTAVPGWYTLEQLRGESDEVAKVLSSLENK
jgi:hypothetical protein